MVEREISQYKPTLFIDNYTKKLMQLAHCDVQGCSNKRQRNHVIKTSHKSEAVVLFRSSKH